MLCPQCKRELKEVQLYFEVPMAVVQMVGDRLEEGWHDSPMDFGSVSDEPIDAECAECGASVMKMLDDNNAW